ncbi:MAG TPA: hypothetical protein VGN04_14280 [Herbaspirillum sp.]|jgi:hypothetical protein
MLFHAISIGRIEQGFVAPAAGSHPTIESIGMGQTMKTISHKRSALPGLAWWERAGFPIRKSLKGKIMLPTSEAVFYLLCDLDDAFADLSTAMDRWHLELEKGLLDADNADVLAALDSIQNILDQIQKCENDSA